MHASKQLTALKVPRLSPEFIDLLAVPPSTVPFALRMRELSLSLPLEKKILYESMQLQRNTDGLCKSALLTKDDEKELATEVLRFRHLFTERVLNTTKFRQAVLTVIQNTYLFRNRKIFFGSTTATAESERQEALLLFSTSSSTSSVPLAKTFQHPIIARVWNRIISQSIATDYRSENLKALLEAVEKLNTLRNIYVLLTSGLVKKLAVQVNPLYKQSIAYEDALQIGSIGVARAAYRYHPSCGFRFSTFAAHWIFREIQRQALDGRLIRISTNTLTGYAKATKEDNPENLTKFAAIIQSATNVDQDTWGDYASLTLSELECQTPSPVSGVEAEELRGILLQAIDLVLSPKAGDILKRRFGLPPYRGREQSILSISQSYQVTRGSIYQTQQLALKKLNSHLQQRFADFPAKTKS